MKKLSVREYNLEDFEDVNGTEVYIFGVDGMNQALAQKDDITNITSYDNWRYQQIMGVGETAYNIFRQWKMYVQRLNWTITQAEEDEYFRLQLAVNEVFDDVIIKNPMKIACDLTSEGTELPLIMTTNDLVSWYKDWSGADCWVAEPLNTASWVDYIRDQWFNEIIGRRD